MSKKTIEDLRGVLFETIEAVKAGTMEIDRAKTISDLAQVMVNTAKAEVDYAKATGSTGSSFLELAPVDAPEGALPPGIVGRTVHRIR